MPQVGESAPDFTLPDQHGVDLSLSSLRGKTVVIFFYPKADTPGCTVEACSFRDNYADYTQSDIVILGISPNSSSDQFLFADKFKLPYRLLADADHKVAEAYGVWGEKNMYGKKYMGVNRTTFVIDSDGMINEIFEKVKPEEHGEAVLAHIKGK